MILEVKMAKLSTFPILERLQTWVGSKSCGKKIDHTRWTYYFSGSGLNQLAACRIQFP